MVCKPFQPQYFPSTQRGLKLVGSMGDGYTMSLFWHEAFADTSGHLIGYNIYFSTRRETIFSEGVKFLSLNTTGLCANIKDFVPGETYYFAVRATQYSPTWFNASFLPDANDGYDGYQFLKSYPEAMLLSNISDSDTVIAVEDIDLFPPFGVVIIGGELISYISKDIPNNTLIVGERGFLNTIARSHTIDGYDGVKFFDNPLVRFFMGCEDGNNFVIQEQSKFTDPQFARTDADGYKEKLEDLLTTDLSGSDAARVDFPSLDLVGWRRTDPAALFNGQCLDTYIGGENFCADGYDGVNRQIRNISFAEQSDRREEQLLELTGESVVLVRRLWTGVVCSCYELNREHPEHRCSVCFGTGIVTGYQQYYNPRRSDGRILVRFGPVPDDLQMQDAGLESVLIPDCWTLVVPAIKDRDFIIRFNVDGTEEFRYEVLDVTRNKLLFGDSGGQKFKAQRVRKFDPINQWRAFRDTSDFPSEITTGIGMVPGPGGIPPHTHTVVINEGITSVSQINHTTGLSPDLGDGQHSHPIVNGNVLEVLGHTHSLTL